MYIYTRTLVSTIKGRCSKCRIFVFNIVRVRNPNGATVQMCVSCKNESQTSRSSHDSECPIIARNS
jgi:hypothetical protein